MCTIHREKVIPCVGAIGLLAGRRETGIQALRAFFRTLKTSLLFPANLAVLIKDMISLINLVRLVYTQAQMVIACVGYT